MFYKLRRSCVVPNTWVCSSKVNVTLRGGQLNIPVRSVTTGTEVYYYNFAQMFFMLRRCVAYNTWVISSKVKVTLKGQLKTIVLFICLDLFRSFFPHSVKDYKIIWYICLPLWDGVSRTTLGSASQRSRSHLGAISSLNFQSILS